MARKNKAKIEKILPWLVFARFFCKKMNCLGDFSTTSSKAEIQKNNFV